MDQNLTFGDLKKGTYFKLIDFSHYVKRDTNTYKKLYNRDQIKRGDQTLGYPNALLVKTEADGYVSYLKIKLCMRRGYRVKIVKIVTIEL